MAAHTARTLLLTGAGVGLLAVASLARRGSIGFVPRSIGSVPRSIGFGPLASAPDRLPAPRRDPHRRPSATPGPGSSQDLAGESTRREAAQHERVENDAAKSEPVKGETAKNDQSGVPCIIPGPLPRPLIPAQRRAG